MQSSDGDLRMQILHPIVSLLHHTVCACVAVVLVSLSNPGLINTSKLAGKLNLFMCARARACAYPSVHVSYSVHVCAHSDAPPRRCL
jgi:hypothetical protein